VAATALVTAVIAPAAAQGGGPERSVGPGAETVRFATYNTSFSETRGEGELLEDLRAGDDPQIADIAEVIQTVRPDILQLGEIDYVADDPYAYVAPVDTGVPSGLDPNRDGSTTGPDDAFGFGFFEGQYGMLVLSAYPIVEDQVRTFQEFRWADIPGALLPSDPRHGRRG
jgi:hypothetical protein